MAGAKIIPIIEARDRAMRDDLYAALVASAKQIDDKINALNAKVDRKIEELTAKRDAEGEGRVRPS